MRVTPTKGKFGKYSPGDAFNLPAKIARVFIKKGKLAEVPEAVAPVVPAPVADLDPVAEAKDVRQYETRMLTAAQAYETKAEEAPYGYKADGTPRKRPGRPVAPVEG